MNEKFWKNKNVFITGHTGFKGSWLSLALAKMKANLYGYAPHLVNKVNLYACAKVNSVMTKEFISDICDSKAVSEAIEVAQPDVIFHLAAQPLVKASYRDPRKTYEINIMGTVNLLEAVRQYQKPCIVIIITTDKVYYNLRKPDMAYREEDRLGGYDPYSASKAAVELVSASYRSSFLEGMNIRLATARAGNVIGGGDFSEDRLIPDIIRSLIRDEKIIVRYPHFTRPWQHVLDAISGYMLLAEKLAEDKKYMGAYNFGPSLADVKPVSAIVEQIIKLWDTHGAWESMQLPQMHEEPYLQLDSTKAREILHWQPQWNINEALQAVVSWYQAWHQGKDMQEFTLEQISEYNKLKNKR